MQKVIQIFNSMPFNKEKRKKELQNKNKKLGDKQKELKPMIFNSKKTSSEMAYEQVVNI